MKNKILLFSLLFIVYSNIVEAQLQVIDNATLKLGGTNANIYLGKTGKYGQVAGVSFDPAIVYGTGLVIENGTYESSGIYFDEQSVVLWSPGDGGTNTKGTDGYLLKVYDEDGWLLRWFIDGVGAAFQNSDSTRKENIEPINSSLVKIKKMRCVRYNYKKSGQEIEKLKDSTNVNSLAVKDSLEHVGSNKSIGFIAQEIEEIVPELVRTDDAGVKFINYTGLIPVAIQAMQEQQQIIESQKQQIDELRVDIELLNKAVSELQKNKKKN
jgi:hypothetical protein